MIILEGGVLWGIWGDLPCFMDFGFLYNLVA
jgi:hypothetical protein